MKTVNDPVVGWTNNVYGLAGVIAVTALGLLKSLHCKSDMRADIVPVDMAINSAIAVAWDLAQKK
jgi:fatty acyl-CoA reductase